MYDHHVEQTAAPVVIDVDARGRFADVSLTGLDDGLREVGALSEAFDRAYEAAVVRRAPRATGSVAAGTRPVGPILRGRPALPEPSDQPHWDLINARSGFDAARLSPVGRAANDCLRVRLDPASSRGRLVDVDPGWLSQAPRSALVAAIHQAFAEAYEKRDEHG